MFDKILKEDVLYFFKFYYKICINFPQTPNFYKF